MIDAVCTAASIMTLHKRMQAFVSSMMMSGPLLLSTMALRCTTYAVTKTLLDSRISHCVDTQVVTCLRTLLLSFSGLTVQYHCRLIKISTCAFGHVSKANVLYISVQDVE